MNITYDMLPAHLAKLSSFAPVYLLIGQDAFMQQDASALIREFSHQQGYTSYTKTTPLTSDQWLQCNVLCHTTDLLQAKRLIELDCTTHAPNKTGQAILQDYVTHAIAEQILLIKLSAQNSLSQAVYQLLCQHSTVVRLWPLSEQQLVRWIQQRTVTRYQFTLSTDSVTQLATCVAGNLTAAANVIEKLAALHAIPCHARSTPNHAYASATTAPRILDCEDIASLLMEDSQCGVFDFINALFGLNQSRCLQYLLYLQQIHTPPVLIVWAILKELRLVITLADQSADQLNASQNTHNIYLTSARKARLIAFFKQQTLSSCLTHLKHAIRIEHISKGVLPGDPWEALQLFCLRCVPLPTS